MSIKLATALGGNVDSTVVCVGDGTPSWSNNATGPGAIVVSSTAGTTVTVNIQGSVDNLTWFNVPYALIATPTTFVTTALVITTTVTTIYLISAPVQPTPYAYLKLVLSANTGMTLTAAYYY